VDSVQAIVLGFVQGITEFLPIPATMHLARALVPATAGTTS
jgi:undecaprenyl pyrophosphate phosphatase UppP